MRSDRCLHVVTSSQPPQYPFLNDFEIYSNSESQSLGGVISWVISFLNDSVPQVCESLMNQEQRVPSLGR